MSGSKSQDLKNAFKKAFHIGAANQDWSKWKTAMDKGMDELAHWIGLQQNLNPASQQSTGPILAQMRQTVTQATNTYNTNLAQGGPLIRDTVLPAVLAEVDRQRKLAKETPANGRVDGKNVPIFWTDIPGFTDIPVNKRQDVLNAAARKTVEGLNLYNRITNPPPGAQPLPGATPADVTNLAWALKTKAQAKGGPYVKGSLTVPNGTALRQYLDTCSAEVYRRGSSHALEQQGLGQGQKPNERFGPGQTARGMDFYDGDSGMGGTPPQLDRLLPAGMNALLYQEFTSPSGEKSLYMKLETEGAYISGGGNGKIDATAQDLQTRGLRSADPVNSIRHGLNLVKSKLGIPSEEDDPDLVTTREKTPETIKDACKAIVKAVTDKQAKKILAASYGTETKWLGLKKDRYPRINTFMVALDKCAEQGLIEGKLFPLIRVLITALDAEFGTMTADEQDRRLGGEVVLMDADM